MSKYVLFQMWTSLRQFLIKRHSFYVEQARKRLLSQFEGIKDEANYAAEEWLEQNHEYFDPDRHDSGDFYDKADDIRIEFNELSNSMLEQTRLSIVAGMFHEWDKQLRSWLVREIRQWHRDDKVASKVWVADFGQIIDLLESFGWKLRATNYFHLLDACRLVVNVYKHGEGKSLEDLKARFPEYLDDPFKDFKDMGFDDIFTDAKYRDHTHLKISNEQLQAFSDAILEFWQAVPENVLESQVINTPNWFRKAILKDCVARTDSRAKKQT